MKGLSIIFTKLLKIHNILFFQSYIEIQIIFGQEYLCIKAFFDKFMSIFFTAYKIQPNHVFLTF